MYKCLVVTRNSHLMQVGLAGLTVRINIELKSLYWLDVSKKANLHQEIARLLFCNKLSKMNDIIHVSLLKFLEFSCN